MGYRFQVIGHGIVEGGVKDADIASLADIVAIGVVAAKIIRQVEGVSDGQICFGDVRGLNLRPCFFQ